MNQELVTGRTTCGVSVWVNKDAKVGDIIKSPDGHIKYQVVKVMNSGFALPEITLQVVKEAPPAPIIEDVYISAMELELGDELVIDGAECSIIELNKVSGVHYIYLTGKELATGRKTTSQKIRKQSEVKIKSREVVKMLALQNAIESVRKLDAALTQMLDIAHLAADIEGKVSLQNSNIKVAKDVLARAARDEMQVAKSQLNELIKKL